MRVDQITSDVTDRIAFGGSPSNANCALRTLRRMLHIAEAKKLVRKAPKLNLVVEFGQESEIQRLVRGGITVV